MSNTHPSSLATQLLADLHRLLAVQTAKHIPTEQLLTWLAGIHAAPWATLTLGKAITARHLARLLQPHGIFPKTIRFTDGLAKGYTVADFADAFARSFVTDKVADIVHVTDRIESAKVVVTDRKPIMADSGATDGDVTDKVVDSVHVTDKLRVVTDRRPVLANRSVTDNDVADKLRVVTDKVADIVHVTDRKPVVAAPIPTPPARNWPPRKGWVWNHQTKSYEPPTPTVQSEPMDQETIRQTLHVSPHLKYVPGYGLTTV